PPPPIDPEDVVEVEDQDYKCTVCGTEVTLRVANVLEMSPPKHCREEMVPVWRPCSGRHLRAYLSTACGQVLGKLQVCHSQAEGCGPPSESYARAHARVEASQAEIQGSDPAQARHPQRRPGEPALVRGPDGRSHGGRCDPRPGPVLLPN